MSLKLAVWDLDGTVIDSREMIQAAMVFAFEKSGFRTPDFDETRKIVGLSLKTAIEYMLPEADPNAIQRVYEDYKTGFVALRSNPDLKEPLYDGAIELLQDMVADGWLMGVATGKSRQGLSHILQMHDLEKYFDTHWCADDGPGKPHPHMVQKNMDELGCFAEQTVMIGDATFDMQMARAANVHALGVSWGFGKAEELIEAGAHDVHHDFAGLRKGLYAFGDKVTS
ncbi:HAD-IA family hydrolase [Hirschia baltica]|uniref:phosphoglycolate phosphatase n=1 Tax=Hirschia baltica (strain ATCC 49814 / DSM 5838 / IFAM 1418) TaxID=582402 RepID=C6XLD5_HIRBI|nr:HAD-IA family hydrolase [Hirschia baltica]ACT59734.1 HAD-superfamily hydrolase, subfamily IA, variant 1 [Hirschia baltica ATCC 49814]